MQTIRGFPPAPSWRVDVPISEAPPLLLASEVVGVVTASDIAQNVAAKSQLMARDRTLTVARASVEPLLASTSSLSLPAGSL